MSTLEQSVIDFWGYSEGKVADFDFRGFFKEFKSVLKRKLSLHGQLGLDNYLIYIFNYYPCEELKKFCHITHGGRVFGIGSITRGLFEPRFKHYHRKYKRNYRYKKLLSLYKELGFAFTLDRIGLVFLMDKCISSEHNSGNLLDIGELRKNYDERTQR